MSCKGLLYRFWRCTYDSFWHLVSQRHVLPEPFFFFIVCHVPCSSFLVIWISMLCKVRLPRLHTDGHLLYSVDDSSYRGMTLTFWLHMFDGLFRFSFEFFPIFRHEKVVFRHLSVFACSLKSTMCHLTFVVKEKLPAMCSRRYISVVKKWTVWMRKTVCVIAIRSGHSSRVCFSS